MQFKKINYHLNQNYFVENSAYEQLITKTLTSIKNIKLLEITSKLFEDENSFDLTLKISKPKALKYKDAITKVINEVNDSSMLLTGSKPKNIEITIEEI